MAEKALNLRDKRCVRTRLAVENALFDFYAEHSFFEKLPVSELCRKAVVSTPVFYRHYHGIEDVVMSKDRKIHEELTNYITEDGSFSVNLAKVFKFVKENSVYYRVNNSQGRDLPLGEIVRVLEPSITRFVYEVRPMKRASEIDKWLCSEIGNYVILELKWWNEKNNLSLKASTERIQEIVRYAKHQVHIMEQDLSAGKWRNKKC